VRVVAGVPGGGARAGAGVDVVVLDAREGRLAEVDVAVAEEDVLAVLAVVVAVGGLEVLARGVLQRQQDVVAGAAGAHEVLGVGGAGVEVGADRVLAGQRGVELEAAADGVVVAVGHLVAVAQVLGDPVLAVPVVPVGHAVGAPAEVPLLLGAAGADEQLG